MNVNKNFLAILKEYDNDIEEMKKAFDFFIRNEIRVGSAVRVVDWGCNYTSYRQWFIDNHIPTDLCIRFAFDNNIYGENEFNEDTVFKVLATDNRLALITINNGYNGNPCYLVGLDGLRIA